MLGCRGWGYLELRVKLQCMTQVNRPHFTMQSEKKLNYPPRFYEISDLCLRRKLTYWKGKLGPTRCEKDSQAVLGVWLPTPLLTPRALPDHGALAVGRWRGERFGRYRCLTRAYGMPRCISIRKLDRETAWRLWVNPSRFPIELPYRYAARHAICSADGSTHTESNKLYRKVGLPPVLRTPESPG